MSRWDEDAQYDRPRRRTRPRTKDRPSHDDAVTALVTTVDRGRFTLLVSDPAGERVVTAMKSRPLGRKGVVVGDTVRVVGDVSGAKGSLARIVDIEERRTVLRRTADDDDPVERVVVANADQLVVVTSMADLRNPFRLRSSERIESEATFLRLFGPAMLDLLPKENLWEQVQIIRSAQGGGKTSLLRLFTPASLLALQAMRNHESCRELYLRLRELGAIDDTGPRLLGVRLSCAQNYSMLEDVKAFPGSRKRLLFGLLNARMVLAALRGCMELTGREYPGDLELLEVLDPGVAESLPGLSLPCSGRTLYQWATALEDAVCDAIDSFRPSRSDITVGHDTLSVLLLLRPKLLVLDGKPVIDRLLFMLDDVHKLTAAQREVLLESILELRSTVSVWIAERFEALSTQELLSSGATEGRDYQSVIVLERNRRFESTAFNIADRRAQMASDAEIASFQSCVQAGLDGPEWQRTYQDAATKIRERVLDLVSRELRFSEWLGARELLEGTHRETTIAWRSLEILIERERRRTQATFDFTLSVESLGDKDDSAVRAAAELFVAKELGVPYYFGPQRLAALASSNMQQFLGLSGDVFEEVLGELLLRGPLGLHPLPARRQDRILREASEARWAEIPRLRGGRELKVFLEAIGEFASEMTYRPTAPYSPGVTGIAISMADRERLRDSRQGAAYAKLTTTLAAALAYGLLEPVLDYKCKNERWMVLYLNRLLCVRYDLPVQYGGWKEKNIKELAQWVEQSYTPSKLEETW